MEAYITTKKEMEEIVTKAVQRAVKISIPEIIQKATRKEYYTIDEACEYLDVSRRHLQYLRSSGQIGYIKNGRKVYFKYKDLQEYMERNYVEAN